MSIRLSLRSVSQLRGYDPVLLPNTSPKLELLRHRLTNLLAGGCFQPHIGRLRDYVFSDQLHLSFGNPISISSRIGIVFALAAQLHVRVYKEADGVYTGNRFLRQVDLFIGTEAVYLYQDEFSSAIEKELRRSWKELKYATWDWVQDQRELRYREVLANEVYQGDQSVVLSAVEHINDVATHLHKLQFQVIKENGITWEGENNRKEEK